MANRPNHLLAHSLLGLALALGVPETASALSLGDIRVTSQLGEPFYAEIPLKLRKGERVREVRVNLGSSEDYAVLELHRPNLVYLLDVSVVDDERGPRVVLRSARPIQEPFFNILLQSSMGLGAQFRNYPVFLDIPLPAVAGKVERVPRGKPPVQAKPPKPVVPAKVAPPARVMATAAMGAPYGPIRRGETLGIVAARVAAGSGLSMAQVMAGIWQHNQRQFVRGNMNGLKAGATLNIPAMAELQALGVGEASRMLRQHNVAWREKRDLDETVVAKAAPRAEEPQPAPGEPVVQAKAPVEPVAKEPSKPAKAPEQPEKPEQPKPTPAILPAQPPTEVHEKRLTMGDVKGESAPGAPKGQEAAPPAEPAATPAEPVTAPTPPEPVVPAESPRDPALEAENEALSLQLSKSMEEKSELQGRLEEVKGKLEKSEADKVKMRSQTARLQQRVNLLEQQSQEISPEDLALYGAAAGAGLLVGGGLGWLTSRRRRPAVAKAAPPAKAAAAPEPVVEAKESAPARKGGLAGLFSGSGKGKKEAAPAQAAPEVKPEAPRKKGGLAGLFGGLGKGKKEAPAPAAKAEAAAKPEAPKTGGLAKLFSGFGKGRKEAAPAPEGSGAGGAAAVAGAAVAVAAGAAARGDMTATARGQVVAHEAEDLDASTLIEDALGLGGGEMDDSTMYAPSADAAAALAMGEELAGTVESLEGELGLVGEEEAAPPTGEEGLSAEGQEAFSALMGLGGEEGDEGAISEGETFDSEKTVMIPPGELGVPDLGGEEESGGLDLGGLDLGGEEESGGLDLGGLDLGGEEESGGLDLGGEEESGGLDLGGEEESGGLDLGGEEESGGLDLGGEEDLGGLDLGGEEDLGGLDLGGLDLGELDLGGEEPAGSGGDAGLGGMEDEAAGLGVGEESMEALAEVGASLEEMSQAEGEEELDLGDLGIGDLSLGGEEESGESTIAAVKASGEEDGPGIMMLDEGAGTTELDLGALALELGGGGEEPAGEESGPTGLDLGGDEEEDGFDLASLAVGLAEEGDEAEEQTSGAITLEEDDELDLSALMAEGPTPAPARVEAERPSALDLADNGEEFNLLDELGDLDAGDEGEEESAEELAGDEGEFDLGLSDELAALGVEEVDDSAQWSLGEPGPVAGERPEPTLSPDLGEGLELSDDFDLSSGEEEVEAVDLEAITLETVDVDFQDPNAPSREEPKWEGKDLELEFSTEEERKG